METDVLEKLAKVLSSRGRKQVAEKNFAMPASAAKSGTGQKGSYPIHDLPHARSALTYGKRFLSADEYDKLKARVYAKYPSLKKGNDMSKRGSLLDSLFKTAGKVPGVPDATGPYGRGAGPGKGTASGLGLSKKQFADKFMKDMSEDAIHAFFAKYWPEAEKSSKKEAMMITGEQARALYKKATLGGTSYADVMKARDASNVEQNILMPGVTNLFGAPTGAVDSTATSTLARGMGSPASGPAAPAKGFLDRMLQAARTKAQPKRVNGRRMSYGEPMTQANRNQKYIGR